MPSDQERATRFVGVEVLMPAESRAELESRVVELLLAVRQDERRAIVNFLRELTSEPAARRIARYIENGQHEPEASA